TVTVSDNEDPSPTYSCTPATGSTFPIGDTTVNCTGTDASGNVATGSFVVHVRGASEQLGNLLTDVTGNGPGSSLASKVKTIKAKVDSGKTTAACNELAAFVAEVDDETGASISQADAAALLADAAQIGAVLGC